MTTRWNLNDKQANERKVDKMSFRAERYMAFVFSDLKKKKSF